MNTGTNAAALLLACLALTGLAIACAHVEPEPPKPPAIDAAVVFKCGCEVICYESAERAFVYAEVRDATAEQCIAPPPRCYTRPMPCGQL